MAKRRAKAVDVHSSVTHVTHNDLFFLIVAMANNAFFTLRAFPVASHLDNVCIKFRCRAIGVLYFRALAALKHIGLFELHLYRLSTASAYLGVI